MPPFGYQDEADLAARPVLQALQVDPHAAAGLLRQELYTAPDPRLAAELIQKVMIGQDQQPSVGQVVQYHQDYGPGMPGQTDIAVVSADPYSGQPRQELVASLQTPPTWNNGFRIDPVMGMEGMFIFGRGFGSRFSFDRGRYDDCMRFENNYLNIGFQFGGAELPRWNHMQQAPMRLNSTIVENIHNTTVNNRVINQTTYNNTINNRTSITNNQHNNMQRPIGQLPQRSEQPLHIQTGQGTRVPNLSQYGSESGYRGQTGTQIQSGSEGSALRTSPQIQQRQQVETPPPQPKTREQQGQGQQEFNRFFQAPQHTGDQQGKTTQSQQPRDQHEKDKKKN
ncbi:MAG TPA: hypothetical protein V6C81_07440 [Planktothrix sp.]|jgi:hypothetical protein